MNYMKDMLLESDSGYVMPFAAEEDKELPISLGYGEQTHPFTGETFNHRGVDFAISNVPLFAVATGTVVGVGTDAVHENYIITKYGCYDVKYGHLSEAYVNYGKSVRAGQTIAKSGDFLHVEVTIKGEQLNPMEFFGMIWANMRQLEAIGLGGPIRPFISTEKVKTDYDADQEELQQMMSRWLATFFNDILQGRYIPTERTNTSLRNIFGQIGEKNYIFESIPTISNALGLGSRAAPLAGRVQSIIIGEFLKYMAFSHGMYLSSWSDEQKKNLMRRSPVTA